MPTGVTARKCSDLEDERQVVHRLGPIPRTESARAVDRGSRACRRTSTTTGSSSNSPCNCGRTPCCWKGRSRNRRLSWHAISRSWRRPRRNGRRSCSEDGRRSESAPRSGSERRRTLSSSHRAGDFRPALSEATTMRIAILSNEYPPYIYGGAGVHVGISRAS